MTVSATIAPHARPAVFDAKDQRRRSLLAKVHLARKEIGLTEDDYRGMLMRVTGHASAAKCTEAQLTRMIEEMKAKGFKPRPAGSKAPGAAGTAGYGPRPSDHPSARKARALWISLYQLGVVANPSEEALEAFGTRQLGTARLQWANQALMYKLVEALKSMAERAGWDQKLTGVSRTGAVKMLRRRLCETILGKLQAQGLAASAWTLDEAAFRLLGIEGDPSPFGTPVSSLFWEIGTFDLVAQGLGAKLRMGQVSS